MPRAVVFIDYNSMCGAADALFSAETVKSQYRGTFSPVRLGQAITDKLNQRVRPESEAVDLVGVRVYYATPHQGEKAEEAAALVRRWKTETPKPYVFSHPKSPEGEKKLVHVQFVTDLIAMWKRDSFDIAVLATVDEDHRPAARTIPRGKTELPRVELAGWAVPSGSRLHPQTLVLGGQEPVAHPLTEGDYHHVHPKRRRKRRRRSGGAS